LPGRLEAAKLCASSVPATGGVSIIEELEKAKRLFDSGAISDAEYQELKSKLLNRQTL
jgi:hypothetical protein